MTIEDVSSSAKALAVAKIVGYDRRINEYAFASELVAAGWTATRQYASAAHQTAIEFINELALLQASLADIDATIEQDVGTIEVSLRELTEMADPNTDVSFRFTFVDQDYNSVELSAIVTQLNAWMAGDFTGIESAVATALWAREKARREVFSGAAVVDATRQFALRGLRKPAGVQAAELARAAQDVQNAVVAIRDKDIKEAELMQANRRFAFDLAWKIQEALVLYTRDKMQRALEAAKAVVAAATDGHVAKVQEFAAFAGFVGQLVGAEAQLVRARADVEIAQGRMRVDITKANLEVLIQKASLLAEMVRGAALASSQLAAGALSAVNLSGSVSQSASIASTDARSRVESVAASISSSANRQENFTP